LLLGCPLSYKAQLVYPLVPNCHKEMLQRPVGNQTSAVSFALCVCVCVCVRVCVHACVLGIEPRALSMLNTHSHWCAPSFLCHL
jgi:hypothetical protein